MFEHRSRPLAPHGVFLRRVASSVAAASLIVAGSLLVGVLGYRYLVGEAWIDAFLDAAMILSGMGPVTQQFPDDAAKLFAGLYALYSGFVVIAAAGIMAAPVLHRFLHRFHLDLETRE